jgi:hypothetical protein
MNVDTIEITKFLYTNKAARSALVADAQVAAADTSFLRNDYAQMRAKLTDESLLPIGFERIKTPSDAAHHLLGWFVTALAVTMGAPFWFDLLNKMMVIRSTVKPHEKSPEESSEDRQTSAPAGAGGTRPEAALQMRETRAAAPATVYASPTGLPHPHDNEEDACDVEITSVTLDEDLPAARGGVATS